MGTACHTQPHTPETSGHLERGPLGRSLRLEGLATAAVPEPPGCGIRRAGPPLAPADARPQAAHSSPRRILFSLFYERGNEARKRRGTEAAPLTGAGLGVQPGASELLANRPPVVSIGGEPGGQSVALSVRGQKRVCRASRCTCPHKRPQQRRECGSGACK